MVLGLTAIALVFSGPDRLSLERAIFGRELVPGTRSTTDGPVDQSTKA